MDGLLELLSSGEVSLIVLDVDENFQTIGEITKSVHEKYPHHMIRLSFEHLSNEKLSELERSNLPIDGFLKRPHDLDKVFEVANQCKANLLSDEPPSGVDQEGTAEITLSKQELDDEKWDVEKSEEKSEEESGGHEGVEEGTIVISAEDKEPEASSSGEERGEERGEESLVINTQILENFDKSKLHDVKDLEKEEKKEAQENKEGEGNVTVNTSIFHLPEDFNQSKPNDEKDLKKEEEKQEIKDQEEKEGSSSNQGEENVSVNTSIFRLPENFNTENSNQEHPFVSKSDSEQKDQEQLVQKDQQVQEPSAPQTEQPAQEEKDEVAATQSQGEESALEGKEEGAQEEESVLEGKEEGTQEEDLSTVNVSNVEPPPTDSVSPSETRSAILDLRDKLASNLHDDEGSAGQAEKSFLNLDDELKKDKESISQHHSDELLRLKVTIENLREDRDVLLKKYEDEERKSNEHRLRANRFQSEIDELKIENLFLKKRYEKELDDLRYVRKLNQEKIDVILEKNKQLKHDLSNEKNRVMFDLKKIREREKKLESQLQLLKIDSESLIKSRDELILELKGKVNTLEFDLETISQKEKESSEGKYILENRLKNVMRVLRRTIGNLDEDLLAETQDDEDKKLAI